jgi:hypothetical protein
MALAPLNTGTIKRLPVRFFNMSVGAPEFPCHAVDDLSRAIGLSRDARRDLLQLTQRSSASKLRIIATGDGLATIAPNYIAQGPLAALVAPASAERDYAVARCKALAIMAGDLSPEAAVAFAHEAFRNTRGAA